jgi:hypothetical protein
VEIKYETVVLMVSQVLSLQSGMFTQNKQHMGTGIKEHTKVNSSYILLATLV